MELHELQALTEGGENAHVEFKEMLPEPSKLIREAIAFANTGGGWLLMGVDDNRRIVGLKDPLEAEEIFRLANDRFSKPQVEFSLHHVILSRKRSVLAIRIPASRNKPHLLMEQEGSPHGLTIIRIADKSVTASKEVFQLMKTSGKVADIKVEYGKKEQTLMHFLGQNEFITLPQFAKLASIRQYIASRTLVHLVRANMLRIEACEGWDRYYAVQNPPQIS
jgi:hypothetical protein